MSAILRSKDESLCSIIEKLVNPIVIDVAIAGLIAKKANPRENPWDKIQRDASPNVVEVAGNLRALEGKLGESLYQAIKTLADLYGLEIRYDSSCYDSSPPLKGQNEQQT